MLIFKPLYWIWYSFKLAFHAFCLFRISKCFQIVLSLGDGVPESVRIFWGSCLFVGIHRFSFSLLPVVGELSEKNKTAKFIKEILHFIDPNCQLMIIVSSINIMKEFSNVFKQQYQVIKYFQFLLPYLFIFLRIFYKGTVTAWFILLNLVWEGNDVIGIKHKFKEATPIILFVRRKQFSLILFGSFHVLLQFYDTVLLLIAFSYYVYLTLKLSADIEETNGSMTGYKRMFRDIKIFNIANTFLGCFYVIISCLSIYDFGIVRRNNRIYHTYQPEKDAIEKTIKDNQYFISNAWVTNEISDMIAIGIYALLCPCRFIKKNKSK